MNTQKRLNMRNQLLALLLTFIPAGAWGQTWVEIANPTDLTTQFNNSGTTYIKLSAEFIHRNMLLIQDVLLHSAYSIAFHRHFFNPPMELLQIITF